MNDQIVEVSEWRPNFKKTCCNCDQSPTVEGWFGEERVYKGDMCGVCTWGEAGMRDWRKWNE